MELAHELSEKCGYKSERKWEQWEGRKGENCTGAGREMHGVRSELHGGKLESDREIGGIVDGFLHGEGGLRLFFRENGPKRGSLWKRGRLFLHNVPNPAIFRKGVQTWFRAGFSCPVRLPSPVFFCGRASLLTAWPSGSCPVSGCSPRGSGRCPRSCGPPERC